MDEETYIPMNKCKDGHLYIIDSRDADLGVYVAAEQSFRIPQNIPGNPYINKAGHWDIGGSQGVVKPLRKLNYMGHSMPDETLISKLNEHMRELFYDIKMLKGFIASSFMLMSAERFRFLKLYK